MLPLHQTRIEASFNDHYYSQLSEKSQVKVSCCRVIHQEAGSMHIVYTFTSIGSVQHLLLNKLQYYQDSMMLCTRKKGQRILLQNV
jgi:hypothetical protein